jgi:flagellar FliL protein
LTKDKDKKMAEEIVDGEAAPKKKLPIKLILAVLGLILLIALTIVGTLAVTGFFSKPDAESIEELLKKAEAEKAAKGGGDAHGGDHGGEKKDDGHGGDKKDDGHGKDAKGGKAAEGEGKGDKATPEPNKFESKYKELSRPLVANIQGSRKVMQVTLAVMTHYDEKVIKNMEKHELALRSAALDILRQTTESELEKPTFRADLAEKIRVSMNAVLEKYENFGGLEQVLFTEFVVQ